MKTPNEWWQEFRYRNDHPTDIIKAIQDEAIKEAVPVDTRRLIELLWNGYGTDDLDSEEYTEAKKLYNTFMGT